MNKATLPRISGPYSFENLSLFLFHGEDRVPSGSYRALQQAMAAKSTARREKDLVNVGLTAIKSYAGSDYPWRAILTSRAEMLRLMQKLGNTVDCPNFKAHVWNREDQRYRLGAYHKIWAIMGKQEET